MSTIYTSKEHLTIHGPNASFGNHILHLLYCLNVSSKRNIPLKVSIDSNLDNLFDLESLKAPLPPTAVRVFAEDFGGNPNEYLIKDKNNLITSFRILHENNINLPEDFWVEGWFQNIPLMPSYHDFSKLIIRNNVLDFVLSNYNGALKYTSLCLHYRGTDFVNCNHGWGDVRLSLDYYKASLHHMQNNYSYIKNIYVLTEDKTFASCVDVLKVEFPSFNFITISNDYYIDWLILLLSKNLISSNSTFCQTASLYNKTVVYQPKNFLLRETNWDICFPVAPYLPNAHII